jgi:hypothetical protein
VSNEREIPVSQTLMPGLHFDAGRPWRIRIDSIDVLRQAFGDELTVALIRCFGAVDRFVSILDVMHMNMTSIGHDSVRGERNLHTLGMFSAGLVYEVREGVRQLQSAGIATRLSTLGLERWERLQRMSALVNEDALSQIRNCLAFHLGEPEIVQRGIRRVAGERHADGTEDPKREGLIVISGDGARQVETRHDFVGDVILAGIRIRPPDVAPGTPNSRRWLSGADLDAALTEASKGHLRVATLANEVFLDLLRQVGANLGALDPLQRGEEEEGGDGDAR